MRYISRNHNPTAMLAALVAGVLLLPISRSSAQDSFSLGAAAPSQYGILALSKGVSITGPSGILGSAGNIGVAGGGFSMSDGSISGTVYLNTHGSANVSGPSTISGGIVQNAPADTALANAASAAVGQSNYYAGLANTAPYPTAINITNPSQNVTLPGGPGLNVANLSSVTLTNGVLTLCAPSGSTFVLNVSGGFSIGSACYIALSGGIGPYDVLLNVEGSGSTVTINGSTSVTESGIVLAPVRAISFHDQTLDGELIGAQVTITSGGHVNDSAVPTSSGGACVPVNFGQNPLYDNGYAVDTLNLSSPMPEDVTVYLTTTNNSLVTVPSSVTILAGHTSASFAVTVGFVSIYDSETITASCADGTVVATQTLIAQGS